MVCGIDFDFRVGGVWVGWCLILGLAGVLGLFAGGFVCFGCFFVFCGVGLVCVWGGLLGLFGWVRCVFGVGDFLEIGLMGWGLFWVWGWCLVLWWLSWVLVR